MQELKLSERANEIIEEKIVEISRIASEKRVKYRFDIGAPDIPPPTWALDIKTYNFKYTDTRGMENLRKAISDYVYDTLGVKVDYKNELAVVSGGIHGLFIIFQIILDRSDEVLIPEICWLPYLGQIKLAEGVIKKYKLDNEFQPDINDIKGKITNKTKAILINSPHNPTGSVIKDEILESIADIVLKNKIFVISDEPYDRIVFYGFVHKSIISLPEMKAYTILLNSFSKTFGISGFRLGYVIAKKEIIDSIVKFTRYTVSCASSYSQDFGYKLLTHPEREKYIEFVRKTYEKRRDLAYDLLTGDKRIRCIKPGGTFYIFPKIEGIDDEKLVFHLLNNNIAVIPGSYFGSGGKSHIRISLIMEENDLLSGIKLLLKNI